MLLGMTDVGGAQPQTTATLDVVHHDVIMTYILPCLDAQSLASVSCASTTLRDLIVSNGHHLWSQVCLATWPSLGTPRLRKVISDFLPDGPRSFFSQSYAPQLRVPGCRGLTELISAVDLRYKGNLIFSKTVETADTKTSWFRCAPFRVDLVDQTEVVQTSAVKHPTTDDSCNELLHDLTLSWILIDPVNSRAANLSSRRPVSVQRHWLSGEAIVQFSSVLAGGEPISKKGFRFGSAGEELVMCGIRVALGGSEDGEMQVMEVSLVMEDMDGKHLNGGSSLVNFEWALEGNRGRRYEEFLEKKMERKERELRREQWLDLFCLGLGVSLLSSFLMFVVLR